MEYSRAINKIRQTLEKHRPQRLNVEGFTPAAVLLPFFNKNNIAHLLLTLRTEQVEHHKGQISFPGGTMESRDASLQETAVRESYEEIGIPPSQVEILGSLDDFLTITNFNITPFVGTIPYPFPQKLNQREVEKILEVPLSLFLTDKYFEVKEWEHQGSKYPVYFYYFQDYIIWGATAFIINRFVDLVFRFNPAPRSVGQDPQNRRYLDENIHRKGTRKW